MNKVVKGILILSTLFLFSYLVWFEGIKANLDLEDYVSSYILIGLAFAGAFLGGVIAFSKRYGTAVRRSWALIGLAGLSNCIAEALWFYYVHIANTSPFPSLADLFYLLFYPLLLAGILSLPYRPIRKEFRWVIILDAGLILVVGSLVIWYYNLTPLLAGQKVDFATIISMIYPAGDFLILAGLVSLIQRDLDRLGWIQVIFLVFSMAMTGVADILFAINTNMNNDNISTTIMMNSLWMFSSWALLMAAGSLIISSTEDWVIYKIPVLGTIRRYNVYLIPFVGIAFSFYGLSRSIHFNLQMGGTLVLAAILLILVYLRQGLLLHDNSHLYLKMEQLAVTDALTTLYNRHSFNETINLEINRSSRHGRNLSLLMIDLDNFKYYNDEFGHLKGDQMLHEFALTLKGMIRKTDYLARYGGDEFVLILPETDFNEAVQVANKIKLAIASRFMNEKLEVSIGVAIYQPGMTEQALVDEADRNLYQHKNLKPLTIPN